MSGRVPPDAQGRRPPGLLQPPSGSSSSPRSSLLHSSSSSPSSSSFLVPFFNLPLFAFFILLSRSSFSRSGYLNCPSAEIFSRIANLWTSPLADPANDVLVCTYRRTRARVGESYREWPRAPENMEEEGEIQPRERKDRGDGKRNRRSLAVRIIWLFRALSFVESTWQYHCLSIKLKSLTPEYYSVNTQLVAQTFLLRMWYIFVRSSVCRRVLAFRARTCWVALTFKLSTNLFYN